MLEGKEGQTTEPTPTYRPSPFDLWRIPDALRRIAELLGQHPGQLALERCLPSVPQHTPDRPIRLRAALASTFAGALELVRDGTVSIDQGEPFGKVLLKAERTIGTPARYRRDRTTSGSKLRSTACEDVPQHGGEQSMVEQRSGGTRRPRRVQGGNVQETRQRATLPRLRRYAHGQHAQEKCCDAQFR